MKRVFYVILAMGLVVSLSGCGESGGGYWPTSPTISAGQTSSPLGGGNNVANNVLVINSGGPASNGAVSYANSGVGGCGAITDFGVTLPSSISGSFGTPAINTSLRNGIMANGRKKSYASGMAVTPPSASSGWTKFTQTTKGSVYTAEYTYWVQFLASSGKQLEVSSSSSDELWVFASGNSIEDVDVIKFHGSWKVSVKQTSSRDSQNYGGSGTTPTYTGGQSWSVRASHEGSSSASSGPSAVDFYMSGTIGDGESNPCVIAGLKSSDGNRYASVKSTYTYSGIVDGNSYEITMSSTLGGDATYGSLTNLFVWNSSTYLYGMGTQTVVTSDGTTAKMVANGTSYTWSVNDVLVATIPSSSN